MKRNPSSALLVPLALLSACGAADNDSGPGGVTVGEARALDEAAAMIEARRLPVDETDDTNAAPDGDQEASAEEQQ